MNRTIALALAAVSMLAVSACEKQSGTSRNETSQNSATAGQGINGTWKADLASVRIDSRPDQLLLQNGRFSCATCTPPLTLAADGAFHPVSRPYADSMAVKADGDRGATMTRKKAGKVTGETHYSVSADGKTLTVEFTDSSVPNAPSVKGKYTETRVAAGPAGSHSISGSWKPEKFDNVSDEALTVSYALQGDSLRMSSPSGVSYTARLDGSDTPIKGDTAGTTASVEKTGDNSYRETDKRDGKVISVTTMTIGADGKMNVVVENKQDGSTTRYTAAKQ